MGAAAPGKIPADDLTGKTIHDEDQVKGDEVGELEAGHVDLPGLIGGGGPHAFHAGWTKRPAPDFGLQQPLFAHDAVDRLGMDGGGAGATQQGRNAAVPVGLVTRLLAEFANAQAPDGVVRNRPPSGDRRVETQAPILSPRPAADAGNRLLKDSRQAPNAPLRLRSQCGHHVPGF